MTAFECALGDQGAGVPSSAVEHPGLARLMTARSRLWLCSVASLAPIGRFSVGSGSACRTVRSVSAAVGPDSHEELAESVGLLELGGVGRVLEPHELFAGCHQDLHTAGRRRPAPPGPGGLGP